MAETVECAVVGAGVVGLAIARSLALAGREVVVLEAADTIGTVTSSRNSEVIHAGIYYPEGSFKARFCVAGRKLLYDYCQSHGVAYKKCGKLIAAAEHADLQKLKDIVERARRNGVGDLVILAAQEARELEPNLACAGAILSPSTGIIDSHGFMLALQGDAEAEGAMIAFKSEVTSATPDGGGIRLWVRTDDDGTTYPIDCRTVINSAGLSAPHLARRISGFPPEKIPTARYAKGNYFRLIGRAPFQRLIYPVPEPGGLGVHFSMDLGSQCKFGPDVEWIDRPDYSVDPGRAGRFYTAIRRYWPDLADGALQPDYAGIRPKITGPEMGPADFMISGEAEHGVPGLINLFGIESPGLTSALAIGEYVEELVSHNRA